MLRAGREEPYSFYEHFQTVLPSDEHSKGVFLQASDSEEDLKAGFWNIHSFFLHGFLHP